MKNQNTSINMELEVKTREELTKVLKEEEMVWAQKAKVNWLQLRDKNIKYI